MTMIYTRMDFIHHGNQAATEETAMMDAKAASNGISLTDREKSTFREVFLKGWYECRSHLILHDLLEWEEE